MGFLDSLFGSSGSSSGGWISEMEAAMGATLFTEANPVLKQLFGQLQGIMGGGAPNEMMIPWIQNAVTGAQNAAGGAQQSARSYFGSLGLGKDPVSAGVLSGLGMQSQQAVANIAPQMSQQFLMGMLGQANSAVGTAGSMVGSAAGSQQRTTSSGGGILDQLIGSMFQGQGGSVMGGLGSLLGSAGAGGSGIGTTLLETLGPFFGTA